jgi:hypothetical protein
LANNFRKMTPIHSFTQRLGMIPRSVHTPETLQLLRDALDDTWAALRPHERARTSKTALAAQLVAMAVAGERDPARLRSMALNSAGRPVA